MIPGPEMIPKMTANDPGPELVVPSTIIWTEDLNSTYSIFSYNTTDIIFERFVSKFDNLKIYNVESTDDLVGFRITPQSQKTRHVHARRSSLHSTLLLNQSAYTAVSTKVVQEKRKSVRDTPKGSLGNTQ